MNMHLFVASNEKIYVIDIESWQTIDQNKTEIRGDDEDGAQFNDTMVVFPTIGFSGCPAYSDIDGGFITRFMPQKDPVWRIKMALNNKRAIALINTFDGTWRLL